MNAPASLELQAGRPRSSPLLWVIGALVPVAMLLGDLALLDGGHVAGGSYWGRDFVNLWTGGRLVRSGDLSVIYDVPAYQAYQAALFGPLNPHNYSYPPVSFLLAALLSVLPYPLALAVWTAGTGAFFVAACRPWWPAKAGPHWLALLLPVSLINFWAGHYGFLLGGLFLLGWQQLDRHPARAGILFGCMILKPHLALMVGVALLARREWRAIAAGVLTVIALVALTSLLFGWRLWTEFLFGVSGEQSAMIDAGGKFYGLMSTSAATALFRLTDATPVVAAVQLALSLGAIAAVAIAARSGCLTRPLALFAATCTFLALPYAFNYDLTVVSLAALATLVEAERRWQRVAAAGAFLAPTWGMIAAYWAAPLIPLALLALACAQWRQLRVGQSDRAPEAPFNPQTALAG